MKLPVAIALVVVALAAAGCGNSTPAPTTTAAEGATVDAARYLADTAAAASAARDFTAELGTVGTPATAARLRALAPRLDPPLARARLAGQRLSAERLADRRLDEQRDANADAYAQVVVAMEKVAAAAGAGEPAAARAAAQELGVALDAMRSSTPSPAG